MTSNHIVFSLKVINDMEKVIKQDHSINAFEIIPTLAIEDKNTSPVVKGENTIGLESWVVRHILTYAHRNILECNAKASKDLSVLEPCLLAMHLLNPEMGTAWNKRKELVSSKKLSPIHDLRITEIALSRAPKCNEALSYRRWLISHNFLARDTSRILEEEMRLTELISDRYHSNYHAWAHRKWCLERLAPTAESQFNSSDLSKSMTCFTKKEMCDLFSRTTLPIYLNDLENNLKFVSSHVSDFSCLSFRMFLMNQIFKYFSAAVTSTVKNERCMRDVESEALVYYSNLKTSITNSLLHSDHVDVRDYIANLQNKLSTFDIKLGLILIELKANSALNTMFDIHEALWCYRRFLIYNLNEILSNQISNLPTVAEELFNKLLVLEKSTVQLMIERTDCECDKKILENYYRWLNYVVNF